MMPMFRGALLFNFFSTDMDGYSVVTGILARLFRVIFTGPISSDPCDGHHIQKVNHMNIHTKSGMHTFGYEPSTRT